MKRILTIILFLFFGLSLLAKPVDQQTARIIGQNFVANNTSIQSQNQNISLQLTYTSASNSGEVYYYVFNTSNNGFVIVSAEDNTIPILGYSNEGTFDASKLPYEVYKWLEGYKNQIMYIKYNNITATDEISNSWTELSTGGSISSHNKTSGSVAPLLHTHWNQSPFYNDLCPADNSGNHAVTGCVATAMAQVMKFWNYPAFGQGYHSYNDNTFGTQSASFGGAIYQWNAMDTSNINFANTAIATLMYHCGVSVEMNYGIDESDANVISAASPTPYCAEYALKTFFGYKNTLQGIQRKDYNDADWISTIQGELDAHRPVIYDGIGTGGGHCFVCDGYDANGHFHINWGWGGQFNGYFPLNALNPAGLGIGGGSGGFNSNQQAIIDIEPSNALVNYNMSLADHLNFSLTTITYNSSFNISTNFTNKSTLNFTGDFSVSIFDNTNTLVDSAVKKGLTLSAGKSFPADSTFNVPGSLALLPGTYTVNTYYRPKGATSWVIISDNGSYVNSQKLVVTWSDSLELYTSMTISPSLAQGDSIAVYLNLKNISLKQFNGSVYIYLYNDRGNPQFLVETLTGLTLDPFSHFSTDLIFKNQIPINFHPGTYLMAVTYNAFDGRGIQIVGSTFFQNPIKVVVKAAVLKPDKYEPDNTLDSAFTFNPVFNANDSAYIITDSANCHIGSDFDFYKLKVPAGYHYIIQAKLNDATHSTNGKKYTLDAILSYSFIDGKTMSDPYDNDIPYNIAVNGGDSIIFKVAPSFEGQTGTYQLELIIQKGTGLGINSTNTGANNIKMYPNPANNLLYIDLQDLPESVSQIILFDMQGKLMYAVKNISTKGVNLIPVNTFSDGIYMIQIQTDKGSINRKFSISK